LNGLLNIDLFFIYGREVIIHKFNLVGQGYNITIPKYLKEILVIGSRLGSCEEFDKETDCKYHKGKTGSPVHEFGEVEEAFHLLEEFEWLSRYVVDFIEDDHSNIWI
jgi:hypothetical protein